MKWNPRKPILNCETEEGQQTGQTDSSESPSSCEAQAPVVSQDCLFQQSKKENLNLLNAIDEKRKKVESLERQLQEIRAGCKKEERVGSSPENSHTDETKKAKTWGSRQRKRARKKKQLQQVELGKQDKLAKGCDYNALDPFLKSKDLDPKQLSPQAKEVIQKARASTAVLEKKLKS